MRARIAAGLTVKLSGRVGAHPARRERKLAKRARGAPPNDSHGPLQRLLERTRTMKRESQGKPLNSQQYHRNDECDPKMPLV
jgi:hypothetical protein